MKGEKTMSEAREIYCVKCGCVESAGEMVYVESADAYYCRDCAEEDGFVECERCGRWHHVDDAEVVISENGEEQTWCSDCALAHSFTCDCCGGIYDDRFYDKSDVASGGFAETWCENCVSDYAVECHDCGDYVNRDDAIYTSYGYYICSDCKSDNYEWCEDCDELFRREDIYSSGCHCICTGCAPYSDNWYWCDECGNYVYETEWNYSCECCNDCLGVARRSDNARIRSYHGDEPRFRFFGKYGDVFAGLGTELEIDREEADGREQQLCLNELDEQFGQHGYFKYDGSLNHGIEIVTLPHTLEEFYKLPWKEILDVCKRHGYSSHEIGTCGLHVHISRTLFGDTDDERADNIAKLMQFYSLYWEDIVRVSRRTQGQVEQWAGKYTTVRKAQLKNWAGKKEYFSNRYMAVNITNNDTVEIRINRGTLKYETFMATIDFVMTTAINSKGIDWADISDDYLWLKGLKKETLDYLYSRRAFMDPTQYYLNQYWEEENRRLREDRRRTEDSDDIGLSANTEFMFDELFVF